MVFFFGCGSMLRSCHFGYESDERSSLGKRGERRRWREERPERSAAVGVQRSRFIGKAHTGLQNGAFALVPYRLLGCGVRNVS